MVSDLEKTMEHLQAAKHLINSTLREMGDVDGNLNIALEDLDDLIDVIDTINVELYPLTP